MSLRFKKNKCHYLTTPALRIEICSNEIRKNYYGNGFLLERQIVVVFLLFLGLSICS